MSAKTTSVLVWTFTILAFVFFFFSLRSTENAMLYSGIALGMWGVAFLVNKFGSKKEDKT